VLPKVSVAETLGRKKALSMKIEASFLSLHMCPHLRVTWVPEADDCSDSLLYFRKFHGYSSLKEYYEEESCLHYLHRVSSCNRDCSCTFIFLMERKCTVVSVADI